MGGRKDEGAGIAFACVSAMIVGGVFLAALVLGIVPASAQRVGPCCRELLDPGCPWTGTFYEVSPGQWCIIRPDLPPTIKIS